jgi:hypothetical protein
MRPKRALLVIDCRKGLLTVLSRPPLAELQKLNTLLFDCLIPSVTNCLQLITTKMPTLIQSFTLYSGCSWLALLKQSMQIYKVVNLFGTCASLELSKKSNTVL